MNLFSRHRIRSSSNVGLSPSMLPLGHKGLSQSWITLQCIVMYHNIIIKPRGDSDIKLWVIITRLTDTLKSRHTVSISLHHRTIKRGIMGIRWAHDSLWPHPPPPAGLTLFEAGGRWEVPVRFTNPRSLSYSIWIFSHLQLCIAVARHNFKWLKIYVICEIEVPIYRGLSVFQDWRHILLCSKS